MKARAPRSATHVAPARCGGAAALMVLLRARFRLAASLSASACLSKLRAAAVSLWARPTIVHVHTSARSRGGLDSLLSWLTSVGSFNKCRLWRAAADHGKQWRAWILHVRHPFLLPVAVTDGADAFARSRVRHPRDGSAACPAGVRLACGALHMHAGRCQPGEETGRGRLRDGAATRMNRSGP